MRILIYCNPKSGSTALAFAIQAAFPDHDVDFEPGELTHVSATAENLIVKYFCSDEDARTPLLEQYDRRIVLTRHPFDQVLSATFYFLGTTVRTLSDAFAANILRRFEAFERGEIELRDLFEMKEVLEHPENRTIERFDRLRRIVDGHAPDFFLPFSYEALVANEFDGLAAYLGRPVGLAPVADMHVHVARTRRAGEWRKWLTARDVDYLAGIPAIADYAHAFGYDIRFDERSRLERDSRDGVEFVARQIARTRLRHGLGDPVDRTADGGTDRHLDAFADAMDRRNPRASFDQAMCLVLRSTELAHPYVVAARGLIERGCHAAGAVAATRATELSPGYAQGWHVLSQASIGLGDIEEASRFAEKAIDADPHSAEHDMLMAAILMKEARWEEAEQNIRRALTQPNHAKRFHKTLAIVLWEQGKGEEALNEVDEAIRYDPGPWHYHLLKAQICLKLGRAGDGRAALDHIRDAPAAERERIEALGLKLSRAEAA
jgi:Flp pilus assembly protein TadD